MAEHDLIRSLQAFEWACGPEFERRYYSDPWVFNLANAVGRLTARAEKAEADLAVLRRHVGDTAYFALVGRTDPEDGDGA